MTAMFVVLVVPCTVGLRCCWQSVWNTSASDQKNISGWVCSAPTMITITVAGILWRWFYKRNSAMFNAYLGLGLKIPWLLKHNWAMPSIVLMTVWWTVGGPMVILLAGSEADPRNVLRSRRDRRRDGLATVLLHHAAAASAGAAVRDRDQRDRRVPDLRPAVHHDRGGPEAARACWCCTFTRQAFNNYRMGYGCGDELAAVPDHRGVFD